MDAFLENAQRIFDVARAGVCEGASDEFALLIRPDGGLHFVMETLFSLEAAAVDAGAQSAYRVSRSRDGVCVHGRSAGRDCVLRERSVAREILRDQPLYLITSPLLTA